VAADPRGNYVYTVETNSHGTLQYIAITTTAASDPPLTPTDIVGYIPHTADAANTTAGVQICQAGGTATSLTVSPDGNRLFITCNDDPNNTVEVWDVSQGDGTLLRSDTTLMAPIRSIVLPVSEDSGHGGGTSAENGCTTPFDIKAMETDETVFGTRVFVACENSDTVIAIDYNSGQGSNAFDSFTATASQVVISTDAAPIANAATAPYVDACTQSGSSCPRGLDLTPNPALHFVSGGYAPVASPVALARELNSTPYFQYVAMGGGTVPRTFSNPDGVLGTGNCDGLSLNTSTGQITGTASNTNVTCGGTNGFIIRVTDASGQIVERAFTIPIN
jgi:WD40 repeat protein